MDSSLNTVSATGQVSRDEIVSGISGNGSEKILFIGNSITRHAPATELGWLGNWGMAASSEATDYVHRFIDMLGESGEQVSYITVNSSHFENSFWNFDETTFANDFSEAVDFDADLIILRLGENIHPEMLQQHSLYEAMERFVKFLHRRTEQKLIITNTFWKSDEVNSVIEELCRNLQLPLADISHIQYIEGSMALGLFEHSGVAMHPGDKGMQMIAEELLDVYRTL